MDMIAVKVKVSSWFKKYTDGVYAFCMELEVGSKAGDLIKKLGIPENEIGSIIVTNGDQLSEKRRVDDELSEKRRVDFEYEIRNGDQILIIPPILGG